MSELATTLFGAALKPSNLQEVAYFYSIWIGLYVAINIVWDIFSKRTEPFHISQMNNKISVLYNASTFTSSLLVLLGGIFSEVRGVAGDTVVPLLLAGLSGLMIGVAGLCPYSVTAKAGQALSSDNSLKLEPDTPSTK